MTDEFPEGAPSTEWTGEQLKAYAEANKIDLTGHTGSKAKMLAQIEAPAKKDEDPPAEKPKSEDKPKKAKKCPRCGKSLGDAARGSRVDSETLVCDKCSQGEEFLAYSQPSAALPPVDQPLWPDPEDDDVI